MVTEAGEITTVKLQGGSNGRRYVTIPKSVVNLLGLEKGDEFGVRIKDNDVVLHRRN